MKIFRLAGCLLICVVACTSGNSGKFKIINSSKEEIANLKVGVCGQDSNYKNLKHGDEVKGGYKVKGDCHFVIRGEFKSGKKIEKEDGQIKDGVNYEHSIEVNDLGVELKRI